MRREWPEQGGGESPCRIHVRYTGNGQEGGEDERKKEGIKGFRTDKSKIKEITE